MAVWRKAADMTSALRCALLAVSAPLKEPSAVGRAAAPKNSGPKNSDPRPQALACAAAPHGLCSVNSTPEFLSMTSMAHALAGVTSSFSGRRAVCLSRSQRGEPAALRSRPHRPPVIHAQPLRSSAAIGEPRRPHAARRRIFCTVCASHFPPRAVAMPRPLRAAAISLSDVAPAA